MRGAEVRRTFLEYFAGHGHRVVPSSPLVPVGDATLLFTNAGMNQFKDVFLGLDTRDYKRAASSQKCLRVSGKHNDLEQVGRTARHHTFFEMLGNFSFGDYFKEEAIAYAWDLVVGRLGVDPSRLVLTVFEGDQAVAADEEAESLWKKVSSLPGERILRLPASENFWRMGDTGPCGPCSEMHYDQGEELGCGRADCAGPACDCDRWVEIWNLVFMQYDQQPGGEMIPLPAPSVDTGMGLERITAVLQGKTSNYDTDLFASLMEAIASAAGVSRDAEGAERISMQVIADHARAISFLIADGIVPSNEGRGYVLRRILRRAYRHGRDLGHRGPFLHLLTGTVIDEMRAVYPELEESRTVIDDVCLAEEQRFEETLDESLARLEETFRDHQEDRRIPGDVLFRLYDTFGLPLDVAEDMARERGYTIDQDGFDAALDTQRRRARESWKGQEARAETGVFRQMAERGLRSTFLGYDGGESSGRVLALVQDGAEVDELGEGSEGEMIMDRTPLYAEAGGQVGERGTVSWEGGNGEVRTTSLPARGLIVHTIQIQRGRLSTGESVDVHSFPEERAATRRNHTATHLLHAALKAVLGPHVKQAGSLVAPDRLRFDFTHYRPLSSSLLRDIEDQVNAQIVSNPAVETRVQALDDAIAAGAVALFGEKYAPQVRVVSVPGYSTELCGGLHCAATGDIGVFKIVSEKGISAGVRRIDALTGLGALRRFQDDEDRLAALAGDLGVPREEIAAAAARLVQKQKELQKDNDRLRLKLAGGGGRGGADDDVVAVDGLKVLTRRAEGLDKSQLRNLADNLKRQADVVVLGTSREDRVSLLVAVRDEVAGRVSARAVVSELARTVGGGGGGKATLAEAGGRDASRLDEALGRGPEVVKELMAAESS